MPAFSFYKIDPWQTTGYRKPGVKWKCSKNRQKISNNTINNNNTTTTTTNNTNNIKNLNNKISSDPLWCTHGHLNFNINVHLTIMEELKLKIYITMSQHILRGEEKTKILVLCDKPLNIWARKSVLRCSLVDHVGTKSKFSTNYNLARWRYTFVFLNTKTIKNYCKCLIFYLWYLLLNSWFLFLI